ncbi:MAG TPA: hypothetical protein VE093_43345 [Polyangiaceae bacterium]|nr:hypothetical protein [Polyangiaceae bacterium]
MATWVTEKVDKGRLASVNGVAGAARSIDGVDNDRAHEKVVGDFEAPGRGRGARRAALWGGLALGATVLVVGFVLVDRADLGGRLARNEPAVQVAHAGSFAWLEGLKKAVVLAGVAPPLNTSEQAASKAAVPTRPPVSSLAPAPFRSPRSVGRPASSPPLKKIGVSGGKQVQPPAPVAQKPPIPPEMMTE